MTQDEIIGVLGDALEDAQRRLDVQEKCIEMLVRNYEQMDYRINAAVKEAETARLHYADQRRRLGLTVDLSGGSLIGGGFGLAGEAHASKE